MTGCLQAGTLRRLLCVGMSNWRAASQVLQIGISCVWQRSLWQQHTGRQPSCVGKTDAIAQTKPLTQRYPPARGEDGLKGGFSFFFNAVSSCVWRRPFQKCGSFSRYKGSRFTDRRLARQGLLQSPRAYRFGCTSTLPLVITLRRGGRPAV